MYYGHMGMAKSFTAQLVGLQAETVTVEVDITNGLNTFAVVGLGDRSVSEAKDRISAAIKNSGYQSPKQKNQKVIISLAPADTKKEGSSFDLAMAVTYLAASANISFDYRRKLFLGELALDGSVRRITGLLPILCQASGFGYTEVYIPFENSREASLARNIKIYPVSSLKETIDLISGKIVTKPLLTYQHVLVENSHSKNKWSDISIIRGNEAGKRGLEVGAAGAHNILLHGPPGTGKTMLAQSFCSLLPDLSYEHSVEVTGIHSAAKVLLEDLITEPPFRSPHHTASYPSIVGGGAFPRPGEITLAHRGVLFLDEFPEFDRTVIEALRQPLEERVITISRAKAIITFPAQCILIAAMNPCPCGKGKDLGCLCSERDIMSYKRKISGPIIDRFDIWINVNKIDYETLSLPTIDNETSEDIKKRVISARQFAKIRFQKFGINKDYNSELNAEDIQRSIEMEPEARSLLKISAARFELSGRAFHRVIKVARTIADLEKKTIIDKRHILEALQYREKLSK